MAREGAQLRLHHPRSKGTVLGKRAARAPGSF